MHRCNHCCYRYQLLSWQGHGHRTHSMWAFRPDAPMCLCLDRKSTATVVALELMRPLDIPNFPCRQTTDDHICQHVYDTPIQCDYGRADFVAVKMLHRIFLYPRVSLLLEMLCECVFFTYMQLIGSKIWICLQARTRSARPIGYNECNRCRYARASPWQCNEHSSFVVHHTHRKIIVLNIVIENFSCGQIVESFI